jgi:hypothetical protein
VVQKIEIKKQFCTIVEVEDIEAAERVCLHWNNFLFSKGHHLKANIHPFSYRKRPACRKSRHQLFESIYRPELDKTQNPVDDIKVKVEPSKTIIEGKAAS